MKNKVLVSDNEKESQCVTKGLSYSLHLMANIWRSFIFPATSYLKQNNDHFKKLDFLSSDV